MSNRYTILGVTQNGEKFRPSDWAERLVCTHPQDFKRFNGHLKIRRIDGIKAVVFDDELRYICADTYEHFLTFARINHLQTSREEIGVV